jgi:hypothetical protein
MTRDPHEAWRECEEEANEVVAQADRRLARPGATKALRTARDRVVGMVDVGRALIDGRGSAAVRLHDGRVVPADITSVTLADWIRDAPRQLGELREQLQRDLVRGDSDARRARLSARPIQPGMRVRYDIAVIGSGTAVVTNVMGNRAELVDEAQRLVTRSPLEDLEPLPGDLVSALVLERLRRATYRPRRARRQSDAPMRNQSARVEILRRLRAGGHNDVRDVPPELLRDVAEDLLRERCAHALELVRALHANSSSVTAAMHGVGGRIFDHGGAAYVLGQFAAALEAIDALRGMTNDDDERRAARRQVIAARDAAHKGNAADVLAWLELAVAELERIAAVFGGRGSGPQGEK